MRGLSAAGQAAIDNLARRHAIDANAVADLLQAIDRGGGRQAQFSHPALGGMGQWTRDGMIMIGDMFNHELKARVDALCRDVAALHDDRTLFGTTTDSEGGHWWPNGLGRPSSSGAQNDMSYAYFPDTRRLAVRQSGRVRLYDTGDHHLGGASQQQGETRDLVFTSQHGAVRLSDLAPIDAGDAEDSEAGRAVQVENNTAQADRHRASGDEIDVFGKIERLHDLHCKGILSEVEYAETKKDLLARL